MSEPSSWHLFDLLAGIAAAMCGWLWRQISAKATKEELVSAIGMLRDQNEAMLVRVDEHYEEAKEARDRLYLKLDEMNKGLGATMVALSRLQGNLDRDEERNSRN